MYAEGTEAKRARYEDEDEGTGGVARGSLDVEVAALRELVAILRERRDAIPEELTRHDDESSDADRRAAAAATQMLSERLTLSFYLDATERALAVASGVVNGAHETLREATKAAGLGRAGDEGNPGDAPPAGTEGADAMAWRCGRPHVDTLVRAYFRIRHGV